MYFVGVFLHLPGETEENNGTFSANNRLQKYSRSVSVPVPTAALPFQTPYAADITKSWSKICSSVAASEVRCHLQDTLSFEIEVGL